MSDRLTERSLRLPKDMKFGGDKQIIFVVDDESFFQASRSKFLRTHRT